MSLNLSILLCSVGKLNACYKIDPFVMGNCIGRDSKTMVSSIQKYIAKKFELSNEAEVSLLESDAFVERF